VTVSAVASQVAKILVKFEVQSLAYGPRADGAATLAEAKAMTVKLRAVYFEADVALRLNRPGIGVDSNPWK